MDVSPKQLVSVAAGLIPFLEHDDANRALMGSNMQRQGVPLLVSEAPLVGTGMEGKVARDSPRGHRRRGRRHRRQRDGGLHHRHQGRPDARRRRSVCGTTRTTGVYVYELRKFMRSNAGTCVNQKPIIKKGQKIKAGDVLADGPNTENGRTGAGPQRARRVHALERLQLRGRHHDLREGGEGGHLHLHPHRRVRDRRPRHQARAGGNHAGHPERQRGSLAQPRAGRRHPHRRGGQAGRHPRRQDHAQERDRTRPGRAPAARHLRREGGGREGHVADGSLGHLRHRDGHQGQLPQGSDQGRSSPRARPSARARRSPKTTASARTNSSRS